MKFNIKLEVKVDRQGNVIFSRPLLGDLFLGRVIKRGNRNWSWEIPVQHYTEVVKGREYENWVAHMDPKVGVAGQREAVHVLVSFHWARGYISGSIE